MPRTTNYTLTPALVKVIIIFYAPSLLSGLALKHPSPDRLVPETFDTLFFSIVCFPAFLALLSVIRKYPVREDAEDGRKTTQACPAKLEILIFYVARLVSFSKKRFKFLWLMLSRCFRALYGCKLKASSCTWFVSNQIITRFQLQPDFGEIPQK